jgi:hypothetical protein
MVTAKLAEISISGGHHLSFGLEPLRSGRAWRLVGEFTIATPGGEEIREAKTLAFGDDHARLQALLESLEAAERRRPRCPACGRWDRDVAVSLVLMAPSAGDRRACREYVFCREGHGPYWRWLDRPDDPWTIEPESGRLFHGWPQAMD